MRGADSRDIPIPVQFVIAIGVMWLPLVTLSVFEGTLVGDARRAGQEEQTSNDPGQLAARR